jgi:hypothetical protein
VKLTVAQARAIIDGYAAKAFQDSEDAFSHALVMLEKSVKIRTLESVCSDEQVILVAEELARGQDDIELPWTVNGTGGDA